MRLSLAIRKAIDFFWVGPLRKLLPLQTFRYAVCGGMNVALSLLLYYVSYHYIFCKRDLDLALVVISPHIAATLLIFPITFLTGFWLNKYVTFSQSPLRGRTQVMRYGLSVAGSLVLNYACMKVFVEALFVFPTISQFFSTCVVTVYSYLMQKYFTFRGCTGE